MAMSTTSTGPIKDPKPVERQALIIYSPIINLFVVVMPLMTRIGSKLFKFNLNPMEFKKVLLI